jgi:CubicO group peptidase (beta-lactamase class C family)
MQLQPALLSLVIFSLVEVAAINRAFGDFNGDADHYLNGLFQSNKFSGAVLVARQGKAVLSKGYGLGNYEHDIPNTPETKFRLGSITKQFTAMCILILHD